ncbi:MAG: ComEC/Rec2 family competence protein [Clostridia bacterium]|nr:ComEC/Rec2 family competence protein [Clostridia bacterium]
MRILGGRGLAVSCVSFITFLFISKYVPENIRHGAVLPLFLFGVTVLFLSGIMLLVRKRNIAKRVSVLAFTALFGCVALLLCLCTVDRDLAVSREYDGKTVSVTIEITEEISAYSYYSAYLGRIVSLDGEDDDIGVRVEFEYNGELSRDDVIKGNFLLTLPAEELYGYPMRDSYISDGIYLVAAGEEFEYLGTRGKDIFSYIKDLSEYLVSLCKKVFNGDDGGLNSALILGDKSDLSDSFKRDVRRLGLSHLLALSGMHLSLIIGGLEKLLRKTTVPRLINSAVMIPLVLIYCAITGFSPSVVRSGIMLIIYYVSVLTGREYDSLTALFLSVAIICAVSPGAVWDIGLALSFFTMLSILVISNPLTSIIHRIPRVKTIPKKLRLALVSVVFTLISGVFAVIFSLPIMWLYFFEMSFMGILLTVVVSPFISLIIILGIFALAFSFIPPVSSFIAFLDILVCDLLTDICTRLSDMRNITFSLKYPGAGMILALLFISLVFVILFVKRKLLFCSAVSLTAMAVFIVCITVNGYIDSSLTRAVYTHEGKNEILTIISQGKTTVCDMSGGSYGVLRKTLYLLENEYSTEIENYLVTHYHSRQISSFGKTSSNEKVRNIWLPEPRNDEEKIVCSQLIAVAEKNGCTVNIYSTVTDSPTALGDVEIIVRRGELTRSDHPTFAVTIKCGDGEGLAYLSSSFWESNPAYTRDIRYGDYSVIRGRHGPASKENVKIDFIDTETEDTVRYIFEKVKVS